jgi:hypothetical protein
MGGWALTPAGVPGPTETYPQQLRLIRLIYYPSRARAKKARPPPPMAMALLLSPTVSFLSSPSAPRSPGLSAAAASVSYPGKLHRRAPSIPSILFESYMLVWLVGVGSWDGSAIPCSHPTLLQISSNTCYASNFFGAAVCSAPNMLEQYQLGRKRIVRTVSFAA